MLYDSRPIKLDCGKQLINSKQTLYIDTEQISKRCNMALLQ